MKRPATRLTIAVLSAICIFAWFFHRSKQPATSRAEEIVVEGFGVADCHVGMPLSGLGGGWSEPYPFADLPTDIIGEVRNKARGITVTYYHNKVYVINFIYKDKDLFPFAGRTSHKIGQHTSPDELLRALGKPDEDTEYTIPKSGRHYRRIDYQNRGLDFSFVNGALITISVYSPGGNREEIGHLAAIEALEREERSNIDAP